MASPAMGQAFACRSRSVRRPVLPVISCCRALHDATCRDRNAPPVSKQETSVEGSGMSEGTATRLHDWLESVGLEKYAGVFAEHEITLETLFDLTLPDIERLVLTPGPTRQ